MPGGAPAAALCDVLPPWPTFDQLDESGFVAVDEHAAVIALGVVMALASPMVVLPQVAKLTKHRSAEGVSALTLAASAIADLFQLGSVAATSSPRFLACESVSPWVCFVSSLPWLQGFLQMFGSSIVFAVFAYFWVWPATGPGASHRPSLAVLLLQKSAPDTEGNTTRRVDVAAPRGQAASLLVVYGLSAAAMLCSTLLPFVVGVCAPLVGDCAWFMASLSVLLSVVGGLPQIFVLTRTCSVGSLSLATIALKLVGTLMLVAEFIAEKEPVSAYCQYLACSLSAFVQVALIIVIDCRAAAARHS